MTRKRISVLGAGVIGMTCANVLADEYEVTVFADEIGIESASRVATAIWHIYLVDPANVLALTWAELTLKHLLELSQHQPDSGVSLITGIELFRHSEQEIPPWHL